MNFSGPWGLLALIVVVVFLIFVLRALLVGV